MNLRDINLSNMNLEDIMVKLAADWYRKKPQLCKLDKLTSEEREILSEVIAEKRQMYWHQAEDAANRIINSIRYSFKSTPPFNNNKKVKTTVEIHDEHEKLRNLVLSQPELNNICGNDERILNHISRLRIALEDGSLRDLEDMKIDMRCMQFYNRDATDATRQLLDDITPMVLFRVKTSSGALSKASRQMNEEISYLVKPGQYLGPYLDDSLIDLAEQNALKHLADNIGITVLLGYNRAEEEGRHLQDVVTAMVHHNLVSQIYPKSTGKDERGMAKRPHRIKLKLEYGGSYVKDRARRIEVVTMPFSKLVDQETGKRFDESSLGPHSREIYIFNRNRFFTPRIEHRRGSDDNTTRWKYSDKQEEMNIFFSNLEL